MKKRNYLSKNIIIVLSLLVSTYCCVPESEEFSDVNITSGATIMDPEDQTFEDGVTDEVKIPVALSEKSNKGDVKSIATFITFIAAEGDTIDEKPLKVFTTFPDTITLDKAALVEYSEKTEPLEEGDSWTIRFTLDMKDGRVLTPAETAEIVFE